MNCTQPSGMEAASTRMSKQQLDEQPSTAELPPFPNTIGRCNQATVQRSTAILQRLQSCMLETAFFRAATVGWKRTDARGLKPECFDE
jgi:hypothetical protein